MSALSLSLSPILSERACVEGALVRVRGVISLVFDMSKSRVACRVRRVLDLAKLGAAIEKLNMHMQLFQVVAKNAVEEVEIPLSKAPYKSEESGKSASPGRDDEESSDVELPEYLPEDEDDELKSVDDPSSAVATTGAAIKEAASSLFSAAASLLQQSFYW
ncbi:hypothetical protein FHG87_015017 [Trinorchestia longiramus]|nr:hypothetical protein FHG87_015017 [Trinorchestia longiramus]